MQGNGAHEGEEIGRARPSCRADRLLSRSIFTGSSMKLSGCAENWEIEQADNRVYCHGVRIAAPAPVKAL